MIKKLFRYIFDRNGKKKHKRKEEQYAKCLWPGLNHWADKYCGPCLRTVSLEYDQGGRYYICVKGGHGEKLIIYIDELPEIQDLSFQDYFKGRLIPLMPKYLRFVNYGFQWDYDKFIPES